MNFIKKIFIKDYMSTNNPSVRFRYGITAGLIGLVTNIIVFLAKFIIGMIIGSIAIIGDAINNLSDTGTSLLTIFGFKLSGKPADEEHPYGHARIEYITGLIMAFCVLLIGAFLAKESITKIINPTNIGVNVFVYLILVFSILTKLFQYFIYKDFGRTINSVSLMASSADSRNDILSTSAVLLATILTDIFDIVVDGYFGLGISILIIISSIGLIKNTIDPIIGTPTDPELIKKIKAKINSYECILGCHDLIIHTYGSRESFATIHTEVDGNSNLLEIHDIIDTIEREIRAEFCMLLTIHIDPIRLDDELTTTCYRLIKKKICDLDSSFAMHDFRLVVNPNLTKVIFDVEVPYKSQITAELLTQECLSVLPKTDKKYQLIIDIDKN